MLTIATWNVNSIRVRLPHILAWLETVSPDIVAIQETKVTDEQFPQQEIHEAGYHVSYAGQRTYNGVAVLSRYPCTDIETDLPGLADSQRRVLATTTHQVRILNLYVPNGASIESDKYQYKLSWLDALLAYVATTQQQHQHMIILGDFNIAPADSDVHDPQAWQDKVLVSEPERSRFQQLLSLGFVDCFRLFPQEDKSFSWWDYRAMAFRRNRGLRIDHILASQVLSHHCTECLIDKAPRKLERPSDHAPVVARFAID